MGIMYFQLLGMTLEIDLAIAIFFIYEIAALAYCFLSIRKADKGKGESEKTSFFGFLRESLIERRKTVLVGTVLYFTTLVVYSLNFSQFEAFTAAADLLLTGEYIILILLSLYAVLLLFYRNKNDIIKNIRMALLIIQLTYTFAFYISGRIHLSNLFNWIGVVLFGIIFCGLFVFAPAEDRIKLKSMYNPIGRYDELFDIRKKQCDDIITLIKENTENKGVSICLSGAWGSGKTSLANAMVTKLKEECPGRAYVIRMNITELFNLHSMAEFFTKSLKQILKENQIYTGLNSAYKKVAVSIADIVFDKKFSSLYEANSDKTYVEQLEELNTTINSKMRNSMIVVVVDDIERSSKEFAVQAMFFIKVISMIDRCIPLFLCDYDNLKKTTDYDDEFFSKYFNKQYELSAPDIKEILNSSARERMKEADADNFVEQYQSLITDIQSHTVPSDGGDKPAEKEAGGKQKDAYVLLEDRIKSVRNIIKIISSYTSYQLMIKGVRSQITDTEKFEQYLEDVSSDRQCFVLSVIQNLFEKHYSNLELNITEFFFGVDKDDVSGVIICNLIDELWQDSLFEDRYSYKLHRNQDFACALVQNADQLKKLYKTEKTEVKQLIQNIIAQNAQGYSLCDVIRKLNWTDDEESKDKLLGLYLKNYDAKQKIDEVAKLFTTGNGEDLCYYQTGVNQFYQKICTLKKELSEKVEIKYYHMFRSRLCRMKLSRVKEFLLINPLTESIDFNKLLMLDESVSAEEYTEHFSDAFSPVYQVEGKNGFEKLRCVHRATYSYAKQNELYDEDDINAENRIFQNIIRELRAVDKMEEVLSENVPNLLSAAESEEELYQYIEGLMNNVSKETISSTEYIKNCRKLCDVIRSRYAESETIKEKMRELVNRIGKEDKYSGDITKRYYASIYCRSKDQDLHQTATAEKRKSKK